ncbi:MAG: DUF459 domain-containing protein [Gammaproteobacteria bacterium]|nr:DUF459 domain-containing protein [Gammaproteobacteria bacterium]
MSKTIKPIFKVIYTLVVSGALLIWLMQDSINAYWTQTYHQQSPLDELSQYEEWQLGSKIHQDLLTTMDTPRWQVLDNKLSVKMIAPEQDEVELSFEEKEKNTAEIPSSSVSVSAKTTKKAVVVKKKVSLSRSPVWNYKTVLTAWKPLSVVKSFEKNRQHNQVILNAKQYVSVKVPMIDIARQKVSTKKVGRIISSLPSSSLPVAKEKKITSTTSVKKTDKPKDKKATDNKIATKIVTGKSDNKKQPIRLAKVSIAKAIPQTVTINKKQMVFFAGDSLMQGVAPHVKSALYKKYGIKGIDLSKQSTGLTYSSFFDWVKTVKETLDQHKNIGLMVMFLGPNDPWNMPNPKGGKYLKFQSADWERVYRDKIRQIIDLADKHKVQVIWLGVPDMRKEKLNEGVRYLNTLYRSEVEKAGGIYLPTQFLLTGKTAGYSKYAMTDTHKKVAVRTNDGVHFTVTGQKKIARRILLKITIKED